MVSQLQKAFLSAWTSLFACRARCTVQAHLRAPGDSRLVLTALSRTSPRHVVRNAGHLKAMDPAWVRAKEGDRRRMTPYAETAYAAGVTFSHRPLSTERNSASRMLMLRTAFSNGNSNGSPLRIASEKSSP